MRIVFLALAALLALIAATGCVTVEDRAILGPDRASWQNHAKEIDVVLEFRDDGTLHHADAATKAIELIRAVPASENLIVVIFAHG